jgi:hypothetical protein
MNWPIQTLTQLENDDWGAPTDNSFTKTNGHHLRKKPLCDFTAEDLQFMIGQQISLPILMPMALDVLELIDPFSPAGLHAGTLLMRFELKKSFGLNIQHFGSG